MTGVNEMSMSKRDIERHRKKKARKEREEEERRMKEARRS